MSWQSSAQMHEARAAELSKQLELERARSAQLEDELALANQNVQEAYEFTKPPITIDTGSNYSAGGNLALPTPPDPSLRNAIVAISSVLGFVLTLWLLLKNRKGK
jgi:hypothetical protein